MLIEELVQVKLNATNYKWYESKGYTLKTRINSKGKPTLDTSEELVIKNSDLIKSSEVRVKCYCDYCLEDGTETIIDQSYFTYYRYNLNGIIHKDCCAKCVGKKTAESNMIIYGVRNVNELPEILNKLKGENNPNWKGGKKSELMQLRSTKKYFNWQHAVYKKHNYTCICCDKVFKHGKKLHAHHIENFATNEDLRFDVDNGVAMCEWCHKTGKHSFHGVFGTKNNNALQLELYLDLYSYSRIIENYKRGFLTKEYIDFLLSENKITQEEYDYIIA